MMTRREKLLIRPWQLRRYNNHKKKVINAVPVVDFNPPPQRRHVTVKLKKLQKEKERQKKIEEDNFKLLQHLGWIMRQKRVDNYWETKPPTFLRRVGIYPRTRTPSPCEETTAVTTPDTGGTRKSKCLACTPQKEPRVVIPEERIPWEPPKKVLTRRMTGSPVVPITSDFDFPQIKTVRSEEDRKSAKIENKISSRNSTLPTLSSKKGILRTEEAQQKLVVRQGPIQIAINFPSFAEVKLIRGKGENYLQRNYCECKNYRGNKVMIQSKSRKIINCD